MVPRMATGEGGATGWLAGPQVTDVGGGRVGRQDLHWRATLLLV